MATDQRPAPTVPQALGHLRFALNASFARASRELGLTPQQAELLCHLFQPRSVGELATLMQCDRSNISHLVARAASHDLLIRQDDATDARVSRIAHTDAGRSLTEQFIAKLELLTADLRAGWSPRQSQTAAKLLTEIAVALEPPS